MSNAYTERFSEVVIPLARIQVGAHLGGISSGWVSLADFHRAAVIVDCGNMASALQVTLWEATDAAGTGVSYITGKVAALTSDDDNDHVIIELRSEELTPGCRYVRVQTANAGAANTYGVALYGLVPRFAPVSTDNWDEVVG